MLTRDDVSPFLAEIAANYDDDAPRLIFADWLEERADPWAELIRVQCELARLFPADPVRRSLEARERELLVENFADWLQPPLEQGFERQRFRRGLIDVTLDAPRLLSDGARLLACSPMVAGVWLRAVAADPAGLVRCEHLRHFHSLNLSLNFVDEAGSELRVLESAHLSNVAELSLCSVGIHWNDVPTLLGNPVIQSLQSLNLSSNSLADWNPERISCESSPANLRELKLTTCGIRPEILESLIAGGWMDRLTSLSLGYNHCGNPGLSFIVNRAEAASLRSLSMAFNGIGRAGVAALCRSPYLGSLESLNLRGNELDDAVAKLFVKSQSLPRLRCLDLRPDYEANPRSTGRRRANMKISNRARKALRERFGDHLLL